MNSSNSELSFDAVPVTESKRTNDDEETSDASIASSRKPSSSDWDGSNLNNTQTKKSTLNGKNRKKIILSSTSNAASLALAAIGVVASSVAASSFSFAEVLNDSLSTTTGKTSKKGNDRNQNTSCAGGFVRRISRLLQHPRQLDVDSYNASDHENSTVRNYFQYFLILYKWLKDIS